MLDKRARNYMRSTTMVAVLLVASAVPTAAYAQPGPGPGPGPDLQPMPIDVPAKRFVPGQTIRLDSGVRNSGYQPTDVFNVKWFVDGQEVGAYGSHLGVPPLVWEKNGNSLFEWTPSSPGAHKITFLVDADNHVEESVEDNNDRSTIVWVS